MVRLAKGYATVGLSLAALLWLLELLQRLEDAPAGGALSLAWQTVRVLPETLVDLLPVVVVLATAAVMGGLNRDQEITAMRAAGISLGRIAGIVLVPAMAAALLALALLQWGTPLLHQGPTRITGPDLGQEGLWHPTHGIWLRQDRAFLNVSSLEHGRVPTAITIYEYDDTGHLRRHISAARAQPHSPGLWRLEEAVVREFGGGGGPARHSYPEYTWESFLSAAELELLLNPPGSLPLTDLWQYVGTLAARQQDTDEFVLVLAQRLVLPLACVGMALVAVAAAVASPRHRGAGLRVAAAMALGLGYQLLTGMFAQAALVVAWPPLPVAVLPPLLLALVGVGLLRRAH